MTGQQPDGVGLNTAPAVSVIIPCRNERDFIGRCLDGLLAQEPPVGGFELIVADGFSTDGTRELLQQHSARQSSVRVIDNPGRIVSTGLNRAIAAARGQIIMRADVHTEYANDYLRQCVSVLNEAGADNVGGPWIAARQGYVGTAIAAAFQSRFGSGGGRAHDPHYEGEVDTVYLGCWRRECFERFGWFDEELVRNQDDEFNLRIARAGGVVWQSPRIKSQYYPRASLGALFRQYLQYGYWKVRVIQKHRLPASWRHVMPAVFVVTMLALSATATVSAAARWMLVMLAAAYLAAAVAASLAAVTRSEAKHVPLLPVVFFCMHVGYGCGFLRGIVDFVVLRRAPTARMSALTRSG